MAGHSHTENPEVALPARLRELVTQPDTILFIGSGASVWSGYPTWPELLAMLAEFLDAQSRSSSLVRRELERGDLVQAASYGFDQLNQAEQAAFLRSMAPAVDSPSALHQLLATLGPTCFITTNYDKLIEEAVREAEPTRRYRVVGNRDLVEAATIVQAHARDYIFKPHGDLDSIDSIVFTREDYRDLQGPRQHVFETLKLLLASRPVIFVGFGLRDPDFLLVKDALATIYQGAALDHYAFMPDVEDEEVAYWRRHRGINLVSYPTDGSSDDPQRRHGALLAALEGLGEAKADTAAAPTTATLALLRHLQRMQQIAPRLDGERIPLMGSVVWNRTTPWRGTGFYNNEIVTALSQLHESVLLIGQPGAGKTVVARSTVAELAKTAIGAILNDPAAEARVRIPVYLELKGYEGSLMQMVADALPVGFPLDAFLREGRLVVFLDALNEVPNAALEDNAFQADLRSFLSELGSCTAVPITRFASEVEGLDLLEVELDSIPEDYLAAQLEAVGKAYLYESIELRTLLVRPVFFRFFRSHDFPDDVRTPHDVYRAILVQHEAAIAEELGAEVSLAAIFSELGFALIDNGEQLIEIDTVRDRIASSYPDLDTQALVNWLVANDVLIAHAGDRVALFHHSVTEYMAALALAEKHAADPELLTTCLQSRHWDHSLLLTLGFLPAKDQAEFLDALITADPATALRSLAYLDEERDRWTNEVLSKIGELELSFESTSSAARALGRTELSEEQEPSLERLIEKGNSLGGAALAALLTLRGRAGIEWATEVLIANAGDFNFCSGGSGALAPLIEPEDLDRFLLRLAEIPISSEDQDALAAGEEVDSLHGLLMTARAVYSGLPLEGLLEHVGDPQAAALLVRLSVLNDLHDRSATPLAMATAGALLARHPHAATVSLSFLLQFRDPTAEAVDGLDLETSLPVLLDELRGASGRWATTVLRHLAESSDRWRSRIGVEAEEAPMDATKAALHWIAGDDAGFFAVLDELLADASYDWSSAEDKSLATCEVSWEGQLDLLFSLLRIRDRSLAVALTEKIVMPLEGPQYLSGVGLDDLPWWIDWITESTDPDAYFFADRLGRFVGLTASSENRAQLIALFESGSDAQRAALAYVILPQFVDLSLDDFTPEALAWVLDDLARTRIFFHSDSLLHTVATEQYVEDTLLPLMRATDDERVKQNLAALLEGVGRRHGRRYVTADGDPLEKR